MGKLLAILIALRKGAELTDADKWKKGLINAGVLAGFLGAVVQVLRMCGVDLPLNDQQLADASGAVIALVGIAVSVCTAVSSHRSGMPGLKPVSDSTGAGAGSRGTQDPVQRVDPVHQPAAGPHTVVVPGVRVSPGDDLQVQVRPAAGSDAGSPGVRYEPSDPFRDHGA